MRKIEPRPWLRVDSFVEVASELEVDGRSRSSMATMVSGDGAEAEVVEDQQIELGELAQELP